MNCPICKKINLLNSILHNVEIDYCPKCLGTWFDEDELRLAKDQKDEDLKWLDVDLWKNDNDFKISYGIRICPKCRVPLYEVYYGDSKIIVDFLAVLKLLNYKFVVRYPVISRLISFIR